MTRARIFTTALSSALLLAACGDRPPPAPAVVAPLPVQYSCAQSRQAAREFDALPAGAMLRVYLNDYGRERKELRGVHNLPDPPKCPPPVAA
jgi:uncharacterized lipoprotein YbaY